MTMSFGRIFFFFSFLSNININSCVLTKQYSLFNCFCNFQWILKHSHYNFLDYLFMSYFTDIQHVNLKHQLVIRPRDIFAIGSNITHNSKILFISYCNIHIQKFTFKCYYHILPIIKFDIIFLIKLY